MFPGLESHPLLRGSRIPLIGICSSPSHPTTPNEGGLQDSQENEGKDKKAVVAPRRLATGGRRQWLTVEVGRKTIEGIRLWWKRWSHGAAVG